MLVDSWYDAYLGVDRAGARHRRRAEEGPADPHDGHRRPTRSTGSACSRRSWSTLDRKLGPGEIGFITASIKEVADTRVGDTITEDKKPAESPAGLQAGAAGGVLRPLPGRCGDFEDLRAAMGKLRLNDAFLLRDGNLGRARLRLPLRLPRPVAPGDHPGAAGARIRSRPDRHRAVGGLPDDMTNGDVIELHNPADMPDP
jgi:GTP-binding protein LepA